MATADPQHHDHFFIQQRIRPVVNQYEVSTLGADGKSAGEPVCFVEQRRFKLKEDLRAFTDDRKANEVFRIKARQVWDPRARYDVTDGSGTVIGGLQKVFGRSLLRSTWEIFGRVDGKLGWAQETSAPVALVRRVVQFVPFLDYVADWLPIPYHFDFHAGQRRDGGQRIGRLTRVLGLRDRYVLDVSGDRDRAIDRRLLIALAVGIDAMQAR
ncbi:MAG: hypothetical protein M3088_03690 [Actinomycetota bacterium]|nr:hypothetical protein [Actinomycetota bacterium]